MICQNLNPISLLASSDPSPSLPQNGSQRPSGCGPDLSGSSFVYTLPLRCDQHVMSTTVTLAQVGPTTSLACQTHPRPANALSPLSIVIVEAPPSQQGSRSTPQYWDLRALCCGRSLGLAHLVEPTLGTCCPLFPGPRPPPLPLSASQSLTTLDASPTCNHVASVLLWQAWLLSMLSMPPISR